MSRNADAVGSLLVPRILRKLGRLSRLGVDDLTNEYALKKLPYESRVRLFCALLRKAGADTFAEAFNASTVAMRRNLASQQGLSKEDVERLQKEAKARLARVLTDELAHFDIRLQLAPAPSPGGTARQPSQHPLYSKAACYKVLDSLVDAVLTHAKQNSRLRRSASAGTDASATARSGTAIANEERRAGRGRTGVAKKNAPAQPKPPFKRGAQVRAFWGGDRALGLFPATVQGYAFIPELRKWTFALNYADGGFDACVKQEFIEGGSEALAAQQTQDEKNRQDKERRRQQRRREKEEAANRPWDNGEEIADVGVQEQVRQWETTSNAVGSETAQSYQSSTSHSSRAQPARSLTVKTGGKGTPTKAWRSRSETQAPSPHLTQTSDRRSENARPNDVSRKKNVLAGSHDSSDNVAASRHDARRSGYQHGFSDGISTSGAATTPSTLTETDAHVAKLQHKVQALKDDIEELRQAYHASLQVTPSTPNGLAALRYRLVCAENFHLRRRLRVQQDTLERNLSARDEFRTLIHATLTTSREHLANLRKQKAQMQDNAADGGTAKGRGSGVGAVAAARNRELQASERTTNAMAVAAGFLRSFISGLGNVSQRFEEAERAIGHDLSSKFAATSQKNAKQSLHIAREATANDNSEHSLETLVSNLSAQLTSVAALLNRHPGRNIGAENMLEGRGNFDDHLGAAIATSLPLLNSLSLELLAIDAKNRTRKAGGSEMAKDSQVDLRFDRVDLSDTPMGQVVDAAIAVAIPPSVVQQNAASTAGAAALSRALHKLGVVLKDQLHGFDERRMRVFRVMQARLAAFDQAQRGDVGYVQRVILSLRGLASEQTEKMFENVLGAATPILRAYDEVLAEGEAEDSTTTARANSARNNFLLTFDTFHETLSRAVEEMHQRRKSLQGALADLAQRHDTLRRQFEEHLQRSAADLAAAMSSETA
eukprot:INCI2653.1.p1 GENE.INCI2653.1~~INCI2653.1.p1  ORF type:complete len:944 (-),score=199.45 INCI2653.1:173-3004(-)